MEYLQDHETFLRKFPTGAFEEKKALWQPLAALLRRALSDQNLAKDARLETARVWAEEVHHFAAQHRDDVYPCAVRERPTALCR